MQQQAACPDLEGAFSNPEHALLPWRLALWQKSAVAAGPGQQSLSSQARFAPAGAGSIGQQWSPEAVQSVLLVQPFAESHLHLKKAQAQYSTSCHDIHSEGDLTNSAHRGLVYAGKNLSPSQWM